MNIESGSIISGKWINPHNGLIINVVNTVVDENNELLIITDQGSLTMNEFSSNFVQCDEETFESMRMSVPANSSINIQTKSYEAKEQIENITNNTETKCIDVIDKLFNKIDSKPEINIEIQWDDFPVEQIKMLINFLDVKKSDISKYIIDKYLDQYSILFALDKLLTSKIQ